MPPVDRFEFWVRFICGFLFFGLVSGMIGLRVVDSVGVVPTVIVALLATLAMSFFVARLGDDGWRRLVDQLRWW